jgi:hypothetical protein
MQLFAYGQYPCVNGISTNYQNAINSQLTSKRNTFFNWEDSLWAMQASAFCFRTTSNESPFYKINNAEALRESKDMKWDDGWELIARYVGLTESNANTASNPEHLYVILYNKYTAILRVLLLACRGADYNAAKVQLKFHNLSVMQTDLLEYSRSQISSLKKTFTETIFSSAVKYTNENNKWFYADFPMMFDPCTCTYKSKLNIVSELISTSSITIQGGITGDILTQNVGGKAQVQQESTVSFRDAVTYADGKLTAVNASLNTFASKSDVIASNFMKTGSKHKKDAITYLVDKLKLPTFLKAGLDATGWLKSAIGLFDAFIGGGKTAASVTQEVKLMPLSVNLTAKLDGSISLSNSYHNIIFSNPGSKDADLDPDIYPYYNEVMGIFNTLKPPVVYWQEVANGTYYDAENYPEEEFRVRTVKYKFNLDSFKYVVNPAAGLTVQNMKVALVIEGTPNVNRDSYCLDTNNRRLYRDFYYEGQDANTDAHKFRTEYYDLNCFAERVFETKSFHAIHDLPIDAMPNNISAWDNTGNGAWLKFMINFQRNNTTSTTQNVLFVITIPVTVHPYNISANFSDNTSCNDSSVVAQATNTEVNNFCNGTDYYTSAREVNSLPALRDTQVVKPESEGWIVFPNPSSGSFTFSMKRQNNVLHAITITDVSGKVIYSSYEGEVNLAEVGFTKRINIRPQTGTYFISARTRNGIMTQPIIIGR